MTGAARTGVSIVVPVHNGAATLPACLDAVLAAATTRPHELVVVDDLSVDDSAAIARSYARDHPVVLLRGAGRGAAAALNLGIRAARYPIVCQVDQDVVVGPQWMDRVTAALDDPDVAAAQGVYHAAPGASIYARVMAWDLDLRYRAIGPADTDHVCTGTTAYRASALHAAGLFDESLGYGYDNDLSYRLRAAGHRLAIRRDAPSVHFWRDDLAGYLRQQYGYGYGRLDLVAKHPNRRRGDTVSPPGMMAHPALMAASGLAFGVAAVCGLSGLAAAGPAAWAGAALVGGLALDRAAAGGRVWRRCGDPRAMALVPVHLARDVAWVAAAAVWLVRRLSGTGSRPRHSMPRRLPEAGPGAGAMLDDEAPTIARDAGLLAVLPAYNERASLRAVVDELRARHPHLPLLIVNDGSTDGTTDLLPELGVPFVEFPRRLGVGNAMRAGLRYAVRHGYRAVVRVDGDGQHRPDDVARVAARVLAGDVDLVLGTRFAGAAGQERDPGAVRARAAALRRLLGAWLAFRTGTHASDPTSGLYAIGPHALRVLADHHPTGYPEPELRLFAHRNHLATVELGVRPRARFGGRTSLTPIRVVGAAARVALALVVVPWRTRLSGPR